MNVPTAEKLYKDTKINPNLDLFSDDVKHLVELMIEFAKLHVEACKKAQEIYIDKYGQLEEGYDEAYPLTNIK
jgi:hypothetical protein